MNSTTGLAKDFPLFRSGHEALRFAYSYNPEQYPMTLMARLMQGGSLGSGRGLFGLEGAAVAGSVKRAVESLPPGRREALICRYAVDEQDFATALQALATPVLAAFGSGLYSTRLVLKLICRYYKRPGGIRLAALCDEFSLSAATMTRRWQRVRDRLHLFESEAMREVENRFNETGLSGGEERRTH